MAAYEKGQRHIVDKDAHKIISPSARAEQLEFFNKVIEQVAFDFKDNWKLVVVGAALLIYLLR